MPLAPYDDPSWIPLRLFQHNGNHQTVLWGKLENGSIVQKMVQKTAFTETEGRNLTDEGQAMFDLSRRASMLFLTFIEYNWAVASSCG